MSIVEKIGLLPILEQLGLTEDQFRGILRGEIEKLSKQEIVLSETIKSHAQKIDELTALRSKANQATEQEKLEIEAEKKKLFELRGVIEQERRVSANEKQEVLILRQKLNDDKAQFQKDREIITQNGEKVVAELKRNRELNSEVESRLIALNVEKDELYITQSRVNAESKKLLEDRQAFDIKKIKLDGEIATINQKKQELEKSAEAASVSMNSLKDSYSEKLEEFEDIKQEIEADRVATLESFRKRELEIARKEKELDAFYLSAKRKKEDEEINLARPETKRKSKKVSE